MIQTFPIRIGQRECQLRFGLRAIKRIEDATGFSFLAGRPGHVPPDSLAFALAVLHAGLIADPKPTMSELEDWLDELSFDQLDQVFASVRDALHKTVYRTRSDAEGPPDAPPPSP